MKREVSEPTDFDLDDDGAPFGDEPRSEVAKMFAWLLQLRRQGTLSNPVLAEAWETDPGLRIFGRFRLLGLLGAGTYGAVFRALDPELGCSVALKIAWPAVLLDPEASRRFIDEPKAIAGLTHPGIVRVYDTGRVEMARYTSFELIEGPTLNEWVSSQERVPAKSAAELIRDVASALHFAHTHGIIHRDLKPSNILMRPGDALVGDVRPVVTDFGLARRTGDLSCSNATATTAVIGTDRYMSPEQASGRASQVGPSSDVFSLGIILYELITGLRPFERASSVEIRQAIQCDDPPPIRTVRPETPRDLETVVLKCLEKSPEQRYPSAAELADDLGRFLRHEPILASPIPLWRRGLSIVRRRPRFVAACSLAIAVSLGLAAAVGAIAAERRAATQRVAIAAAAADEAKQLRRQHEYALAIRSAAASHALGNAQETRHHLQQAEELAQGETQRGMLWGLISAGTDNADLVFPSGLFLVRSVRCAPQGSLLACGGAGGVRFWDTQSWRELPSLDTDSEVSCLEFSADAEHLAVGDVSGRLLVVRAADRSIVYDHRVFQNQVHSTVWVGGDRLIAGGQDCELASVHLSTSEVGRSEKLIPPAVARQWHRGDFGIRDLLVLPDRNQLLVRMWPAGLFLFDADTLRQLEEWQCRYSRSSMCYTESQGGCLLLSGGDDIQVLSAKDGRTIEDLPMKQVIVRLNCEPGSQLIAGFSINGSIRLWNAEELLAGKTAPMRQFVGHGESLVEGAFSRQGDLVGVSKQGDVRIWKNAAQGLLPDTPMTNEPCWLSFSPCGRWLAMTERMPDSSGQLSVFDVASGVRSWSAPLPVTAYPPSRHREFFMRWYPGFNLSGDALMIHEPDGGISLRESRTGRTLRRLDVTTTQASVFYFAPSDNELCIASPGGAELVELTGGALRRRIGAPQCLVRVLRADPDIAWLERDLDRVYRLKSTDPDVTFRSIGQLTHELVATSLSRDNRHLAGADYRRNVFLWNLNSDVPPGRLVAPDRIVGLSFIDNGQTLVGWGTSGTLTFWHVPTRTELLTVGSAQEQIKCFAVHPRQQMLVLGIERDGEYLLRVHRIGDAGQMLSPTFEVDSPGTESKVPD